MKGYNISIKQAQSLREKLKTLQGQIRELKEQQGRVKGTQRAGVTRQITFLEKDAKEILEQLVNAPPEPLSPELALAKIHEPLLAIREDFQKAKDTFLRRFQVNPTHGIEYSEDVVKAQERYKFFQHSIQLLEENGGFSEVVAAFEGAIERIEWNISANPNIMNSTSMNYNVIRLWQTEQLLQIHLNRDWQIAELKQKIAILKERVAIWEEENVQGKGSQGESGG